VAEGEITLNISYNIYKICVFLNFGFGGLVGDAARQPHPWVRPWLLKTKINVIRRERYVYLVLDFSLDTWLMKTV
jgi:hypothetical protein